ncbi:hypothetical protein QQS21_010967 [Conoideocrella luteorostrata]|uniref:Neprosin PEP catalytic domain-containing protein n=1 Tax=Conoideocrella luteorostrata TaxID=1105319 RepID=A0AAJ0FNZ0_9HYPO|nr:hypothetical protein QQS21_010967 [Conoideocrella luteorostrata]
MRLQLIKTAALAALVQSTSAAPASDKASFEKLPNLDVVKTTTDNGITLDWVTRESQGKVYSPPPDAPEGAKKLSQAQHMNVLPQFTGPDGTVPIARLSNDVAPKQLPPFPNEDNNSTEGIEARAIAGTHWYAASWQQSRNHGGRAFMTIHKPFLEREKDFSLLQIAVAHDKADQPNNGAKKSQTVEAGWTHYPVLHKGGPILFTFFTTNGYNGMRDYVGGYNTAVKGWFQHDSAIHPGMPLSRFSVDGGQQQELEIMYQLHDNCWWLYTMGKYIGCYPTSLFHPNGVNPKNTLGTVATGASLYGEVVNSGSSLTKTDMGSGHFAKDGWKHSAYMREMKWFDTNGKLQDWDGPANAANPDRYSIQTKFKSGLTNWNSHMFLGGPGAGGKVGA